MGDLFHEIVLFSYIKSVFDVMQKAKGHIYQVLTKRPERMLKFINWYNKKNNWQVPENIWLGVTAENQEMADKRIPILLQIPAAVRFVSCEPLLGPVDLSEWLEPEGWYCENCQRELEPKEVTFTETHDIRQGGCGDYVGSPPSQIDWVICGGETGPDARPIHPDWVRSLRDQCQAAGVSFFFKQWGEWLPYSQTSKNQKTTDFYEVPFFSKQLQNAAEEYFGRVGKKKAGRLLDGRTWDEYPKIS
jgi:protein gp37